MALATSLRPLPVASTTMRSSGSIRPSCTSFTRPAKPAAPAGSAKTAAPRARTRMASRISSSLTATYSPPVCRTARRALMRSRGTPTEMLSARVLRTTGSISSVPSRQALTKGAAPSACTPINFGILSMKPRARRSLSPFQSPPMMQPSPTETKIRSGASHRSCSQISKAAVFFPSER